MVYCSKCGTENKDDDNYCSNCGERIKKSKFEKQVKNFAEEAGQIGKKVEKKIDDIGEGKKKLYRSGKDKILGGVCGGLAEYFDLDPILVRVLGIVSLLVTIGGILLAYILLWIFVPRNPNHKW